MPSGTTCPASSLPSHVIVAAPAAFDIASFGGLVAVAVEDAPDDRARLGGRRRPRRRCRASRRRSARTSGRRPSGETAVSSAATVSIVIEPVRVVGPFPHASCGAIENVYVPSGQRAWRRRGRPRSRRSRRPMPVVSWSTVSRAEDPDAPVDRLGEPARQVRGVGAAVAVGREPAAERVDRPDLRRRAVARQRSGVDIQPLIDGVVDALDPDGGRSGRGRWCCRWRPSAGARRPGRSRAAGRCAVGRQGRVVIEARAGRADLGVAGHDERRRVRAGVGVRGAGDLVGRQAGPRDERAVVAARGAIGVGVGGRARRPGRGEGADVAVEVRRALPELLDGGVGREERPDVRRRARRGRRR